MFTGFIFLKAQILSKNTVAEVLEWHFHLKGPLLLCPMVVLQSEIGVWRRKSQQNFLGLLGDGCVQAEQF